jgi:hypothetical protein
MNPLGSHWLEPDEKLALRFIDEYGGGVHPGYFFDFDSDGPFRRFAPRPP